MRDLLLIIHIVSIALWLGGGIMTGLVNQLVAGQASIEASARLARAETRLGRIFYMPLGILTLLSGIGLVLASDAYSFADPFVGIGFLAILVAAVLGPVKFEPIGERIAAGYESGDTTAALVAVKEMRLWSTVDMGLILIAIVFMVVKP